MLRVVALRPRPIDLRFVSATHRDLEDASSGFRSDLYFRLAAHVVALKPLRERVDELPELTVDLLNDAARAAGRAPPTITRAAMEAIIAYSWPGNVRELRNVVQRALLLADGGAEILPAHLPLEKMSLRVAAPASSTLESSVQEHERRRIAEALALHGGNQTRAAQALGIARSTLLQRMDAFGLTRPRKR